MQSGKQIHGHGSKQPSGGNTSTIRQFFASLLNAMREGSEMQMKVHQYRWRSG